MALKATLIFLMKNKTKNVVGTAGHRLLPVTVDVTVSLRVTDTSFVRRQRTLSPRIN